jgi:GDP-D-mannose dehydratase
MPERTRGTTRRSPQDNKSRDLRRWKWRGDNCGGTSRRTLQRRQGSIGSGRDLPAIGQPTDCRWMVVRLDPRQIRPSEPETLLGDTSGARERLCRKPATNEKESVVAMVIDDSREARKEVPQ